ncbi:MAG TPA: M20/M25/M40 family metallo-hydrolase [Pirellula sp.]|nr:M20/M25/M40 family metallo-hydrolase [Pirellula sp.]
MHYRGLPSLALFVLSIAFLAVGAQAQFSGSIAPPADFKTGFDSITDERAQEWLSILAGPVFEGRGSGQKGYTKAAHWVAGKVAEFGLDPAVEGGTYFQMLPMSRLWVEPTQSKLTGPNDLSIFFDKAIGLERFTNVPEVSGGAAFVKLVGDSPKLEDTTSLRDKIVFYTVDEKARGHASGVFARQKPLATFRIVDEEPKSGSQLLREGGRQRAASLSGTISTAATMTILKSLKGDPSWLKTREGNGVEVHFAEGNLKLELRYREEPTTVPNVLAWQPGSDPELRSEHVVIGAHLDHLGIQNGSVFPGADDNGSGSTALLGIARAISANPIKPKRSVLFIWFAGEEIGLLGSAYYVEHPLLPLEKILCMLNVDMVGRNEEKQGDAAVDNETSIHLVGSKKGDPDLHDVIINANRYVNFAFEYDEEGVFGRSDQANFFKSGTSVAFLFGGFHPDYHKPTDQISKINFHKIASAAKLFYLTAHLAAEHGVFKIPQIEEKKAGSQGK